RRAPRTSPGRPGPGRRASAGRRAGSARRRAGRPGPPPPDRCGSAADLQFGPGPLQVGNALLRDPRPVQDEGLEVAQTPEVNQARVRDPGVVEVQDPKRLEPFEVRQARVRDPGAAQEKDLKSVEPPEAGQARVRDPVAHAAEVRLPELSEALEAG